MSQSKEDKKCQFFEINTIRIWALHGGEPEAFSEVGLAIAYVKGYDWNESAKALVKFEITITYTSGLRSSIEMPNRGLAVDYLSNRQKGIL